jgi:cytochrome oxidase Cu insertion factor (SCO1/SenC/PrrC family)
MHHLISQRPAQRHRGLFWLFAALLTGVITSATAAEPASMSAALAVGDQAPDFSLRGSDGNTYTLAQFRGHRPVVIAFFPKAFTGG